MEEGQENRSDLDSESSGSHNQQSSGAKINLSINAMDRESHLRVMTDTV